MTKIQSVPTKCKSLSFAPKADVKCGFSWMTLCKRMQFADQTISGFSLVLDFASMEITGLCCFNLLMSVAALTELQYGNGDVRDNDRQTEEQSLVNSN